jgi:hypothetical protein
MSGRSSRTRLASLSVCELWMNISVWYKLFGLWI